MVAKAWGQATLCRSETCSSCAEGERKAGVEKDKGFRGKRLVGLDGGERALGADEEMREAWAEQRPEGNWAAAEAPTFLETGKGKKGEKSRNFSAHGENSSSRWTAF
jgi:hypothetical protein